MTGTTSIDEGGLLEGPIFITNTHRVGTVRDNVRRAVRHMKIENPFAIDNDYSNIN